VTDVGIRTTFGHPDPMALGRVERRVRLGGPSTRPLLAWDLTLAALAAAATAVARPVAPPAVLAVLLGCWAGCLVLGRASSVSVLDSRAQQLDRVVRAGCTFALVGSAVSILPWSALTAGQVFAMAAVVTAISCGVRVVATAGRAEGCVVVVGGPEERRHAVAALARRPGPALRIVAVSLAVAGREPAPGEVAVPLGELPLLARRVGAQSVVAVPGTCLDPVELRRLRWLLERDRLPYFVGTSLVGVATDRIATLDVGGVPMVRVHSGQRSGLAWQLVGWGGRFLALLALVMVAPVLLLAAIAIRHGSPGPAIFRQVRVGRDGRTFRIYKLRTMVAAPVDDAPLVNDVDGVLFKMRQDPRVTPLGRWLRKYSLDELPQLLNVVRGQMRLVGPRPALPDEVAEYSDDERRRLAMPPGITGLWQVSGRSDLTWEETVRLDLHYVDNWSPTLDLFILCRTVRAVLGHRGAY
jgi:exopolysaccharide biosynthesis polyprenyl glycosylphosphotransferase